MSPRSAHHDYSRRILDEVEATRGVTQRLLARRLGIALGLTNLLIKRLIRKGWVRVIHVKSNRVMYLITPAGIAEKARMTRAYLAQTTRFYAEARDRIRDRFAVLSTEWPAGNGGPRAKPIAFFGAGEVAEIGYVCLQETDLSLVAVVDDTRVTPFFGLPVRPSSALANGWDRDDVRFERLVVMSFDEVSGIRERLDRAGVSPQHVFWI